MRTLLEEYVPAVYRFALRLSGDRHQAEELTQETLLRAWQQQDRLREPKAARVWLLRIAANLWNDQFRQRSRRPGRADVPIDCQEGAGVSPDRAAVEKEDVQRALEAMDSLPGRQREVLYLHACEQLSLAQIAEVLQISLKAVRASLSLARKKMRQQLGDVCRERCGDGRREQGRGIRD